jgi:galactose-1-phosphate uridylyltransferase
MLPEMIPEARYLMRMADGTIKQVNPFTGTEVWTVPGRANRPLGLDQRPPRPLEPAAVESHCAFCPGRCLETPPEKARLVMTGHGAATVRMVRATDLMATVAEFRRVANLFEIVPLDYWQRNFGHPIPQSIAAWKTSYLSSAEGRHHVESVLSARLRAGHAGDEDIRVALADPDLSLADAFFAGGHELIIARRHFVDGARFDNELASSGTLTPEQHYQYVRFTIEATRDLFLSNRYVRYVAIFQNWLKPAGASFDHLHKQLVAIDERGVQNEREVGLVRANPNIFNEAAVNFAGYRNLVFAENDHAIAFSGFGHRFPTLEVYSKSERSQPWNHSAEELRAMSDLVHACHAATGPAVPCNEEWHYKPPDADVGMPWRVLIKWRISTPAGFEGGTRIYINTIDPESLRDRIVERLYALRNEGKIATMKIASECACTPNCLKYNPAVRQRAATEPEFPPLSGSGRIDP